MKKNQYTGMLLAALTGAAMLAGCSSVSAQNSQLASPPMEERKSLQSSQTSSRTKAEENAENGASKEQQKPSDPQSGLNQKSSSDKNSSKQSSSNEEDKNDDLQLSSLSAVSGNAVDLSSLSSNALIEKGGTYTLSGSTQKTVVVDAKDQDVTLVLDQASIQASSLPAIYVRNAKSVSMEVRTDSTLSSKSHDQAEALNAAVYVRSPLTISGSGKLSVSSGSGHAIKAKDDMLCSGAVLNLTSEKDGIHASDSLQISGGTYTVKANDEGMEANADLKIASGTFSIISSGDGLKAEETMELTNGTYAIEAQGEGLESKGVLLIRNGTYTISAVDDGINAGDSLTIQNGTFNIVSSRNDALDSNGDLILEGGTIHAVALSAPEGAFDTDGTPFEIRGGTIVGLSAAASLPSSCTQNTVMINAGKSFSKLELKQNGRTLISWTNENQNASSQSVLTLSCKELLSNQEAQIYLDGTLLETFTVEEGLTKVGNIQTMGGGRGMGGGMPQNGQMNGQRPEMPEGEQPGQRMPGGQRPEENDEFFSQFEGGQNRAEKRYGNGMDENQNALPSRPEDNEENSYGQSGRRNRRFSGYETQGDFPESNTQNRSNNSRFQEDTSSSATV